MNPHPTKTDRIRLWGGETGETAEVVASGQNRDQVLRRHDYWQTGIHPANQRPSRGRQSSGSHRQRCPTHSSHARLALRMHPWSSGDVAYHQSDPSPLPASGASWGRQQRSLRRAAATTAQPPAPQASGTAVSATCSGSSSGEVSPNHTSRNNIHQLPGIAQRPDSRVRRPEQVPCARQCLAACMTQANRPPEQTTLHWPSPNPYAARFSELATLVPVAVYHAPVVPMHLPNL